MLLSTSTGRPVTSSMIRTRWESVRDAAAEAPPELADQLRSMYLRDTRKPASDLANSDESASRLLQHSNVEITRRHYRTRPVKLKPVR